MNNSKSCVSYVCTGSGCTSESCERHDIGAQCGATATNIAAQTTRYLGITVLAINNQQNWQNSQKLSRQLEVVSSPAEETPE